MSHESINKGSKNIGNSAAAAPIFKWAKYSKAIGGKRKMFMMDSHGSEDKDDEEDNSSSKTKKLRSDNGSTRQFQYCGSKSDKARKNFDKRRERNRARKEKRRSNSDSEDDRKSKKDPKKDKKSEKDKGDKGKSAKSKNSEVDLSQVRCYRCDKKGHYARNCDSKKKA